MAERSTYAQGEPCWSDVTVADPRAAQDFYGPVFGWTFVDQGEQFGHYTMCMLNGAPVAALSPPPPGSEDMPPVWGVYLSTPDVDAALAAAERAGGRVAFSPMDIPGSGRMAYVFDPTGAGIGFWQAEGFVGAARRDEPGAVGWCELVTADGAAADRFYQAVFSYEAQDPLPDVTMDYTVWKTDGREVCGRLATADDPPPRWLTYFGVADADGTAATVGKLGGQVFREPWDTPFGRMVGVADPFGARFIAFQAPPDR
ncbi:VOC family protein [Actinocatenispora rupis]|uniref:Hydrolase n=1 Tax=Actinocatenispora rupis TaxID=519421 RepID=A0A8J3JCF7_9ACTN|nr:VOC family protein [Actinocatenispora rupis]GID15781.1 hydrolase [Actinocatenispora rupis]